jgi:hypothetical protein
MFFTDEQLLQQMYEGGNTIDSSAIPTSVPPKNDVTNSSMSSTFPAQHHTSSSDVTAMAWKQVITLVTHASSSSLDPHGSSSSSSSLSLPYIILCDVFEQIEAITSRLQIQDILTTLFRKLILLQQIQFKHPPLCGSSPSTERSPTSTTTNSTTTTTTATSLLYPILYLCSNTVAPAYQCVELGIGDALLQKAIGEACGLHANQVKAKYEVIGDLGIVAQQVKSKQKTLGGFFKSSSSQSNTSTASSTATSTSYGSTLSSSASSLSIHEVLLVFREIASTKGAQAQKWKVDRIKKLLVRASSGIETKYIIRGLQGKLRIGLAQSTVLIALAHALALTIPPTVVSTTTNQSTHRQKIHHGTFALDDKNVFAFVFCSLSSLGILR